MELSSHCCTDINIHVDLWLVSQGISVVYKGIKPLIMYDVVHAIAMEPMKGKWASCRFDLGYTKLFSITEVTAVFLPSCDSGLGESLVFHQAHWGSFHVWLGTRNCSVPSAGDSGLNSRRGGWLMGFSSCSRNLVYILEFQLGWPFESPLSWAKSGLQCSYDGHLRNLN